MGGGEASPPKKEREKEEKRKRRERERERKREKERGAWWGRGACIFLCRIASDQYSTSPTS